jgi:hypothetical protein
MAYDRIGRVVLEAAGIGHPSARRRSKARQVLTTTAKAYAISLGARMLLRRKLIGAFCLGAVLSWWFRRK